MSCSINQGLTRDCNYFLAGLVNKIYVANYADITYAITGNLVTGITGGVFYEFEVNPESASAASEMQVANNRRYFQQTIQFSNDSISSAAISLLEDLGLATTTVIVETKNGERLVFGNDGGLQTTVLSSTSGAQAGDAAGNQVTLLGVGKRFQLSLDSAVSIPLD
jgi:hypothetical protein